MDQLPKMLQAPGEQVQLQQKFFQIAGKSYVASPYPQTNVNIDARNESLVTVIRLPTGARLDKSFLERTVLGFSDVDDVFCVQFLHGIYICRSSGDIHPEELDAATQAYLSSIGNKWHQWLDADDQPRGLNQGVYLASNHKLFEVYRLYTDVQGAFTQTFIPGQDGGHVPVGIAGDDIGNKAVAVPTRIKSWPTGDNYLRGLRIAIKDNFEIKAIRTTLGNLAYYETYGPQECTAACIAQLEGSGAALLGATKLASFAATEEPLECIDFSAPWNPRADGHQSPAGSSSGSGVAMASYPWLDVAIGSDTSGSGRRPAHWNGTFAMRPTHGLLNAKGLVPSFPRFDTPTFFTRGIQDTKMFASAWYGGKLKSVSQELQLPFKIIVPTNYMDMISNPEQMVLLRGVIDDLKTVLEAEICIRSLAELWTTSPPREADDKSLLEYMAMTCKDTFFFEDYHNLDTFRADYCTKFGRYPYVSPPVRWQWDISKEISQVDHDEGMKRLDVFKRWFLETVMEQGRKNTIVVIPIEDMAPRYRDRATTNFNPVGVPMLFLSPIIGGPELTIPIGTVSFESEVTKRTEHMPVAVSLLTEPNADLLLIDWATKMLQGSGRPTEVSVGQHLFEGDAEEGLAAFCARE